VLSISHFFSPVSTQSTYILPVLQLWAPPVSHEKTWSLWQLWWLPQHPPWFPTHSMTISTALPPLELHESKPDNWCTNTTTFITLHSLQEIPMGNLYQTQSVLLWTPMLLQLIGNNNDQYLYPPEAYLTNALGENNAIPSPIPTQSSTDAPFDYPTQLQELLAKCKWMQQSFWPLNVPM